jgi:sulfur transfer complex TusBCD TusB component (DsrH family)
MSLVQEDIMTRLLVTLTNYVELLISMIREKDQVIAKKNAVIDSLTEVVSLQNGIIAALKDDF